MGTGTGPDSRIAVASVDAMAGARADCRVETAGGVAIKPAQADSCVVVSGCVKAQRPSAGGGVDRYDSIVRKYFLTDRGLYC